MIRALAVPLLVLVASACSRDRSSELEHRVEAALRDEPAATPISVEAKDGIVTLTGVVDSEGDRAHLRDVARSVPGVVAVDDDRVTVRPPPTLTAATPEAILAAAIESRLRAADFQRAYVHVHDKTVRVAGTVPKNRRADAMQIVVENAPRDYRIEDALAERALP